MTSYELGSHGPMTHYTLRSQGPTVHLEVSGVFAPVTPWVDGNRRTCRAVRHESDPAEKYWEGAPPGESVRPWRGRRPHRGREGVSGRVGRSSHRGKDGPGFGKHRN